MQISSITCYTDRKETKFHRKGLENMRALITGATSGIGKEMAIYLHRMGWQLVLTGRNEEILKMMAERFGEGTKYIAIDLAKPDAPQKLYEFCRGTRIDFLINNAGFGIFGEFSETSLESELELINLNVRAVHILTKLFVRDFEKRGSGYIMNVGSVAGFMTGPLMSSYYASKNYVVRLTLAIREELRRKGSNVKISVLCPGPVNTDFNNRAGVAFSLQAADAKYVARYAIEQTLRGQAVIVPMLMIRLGLLGAKLCPTQLQAAIVCELQKKKLGNRR